MALRSLVVMLKGLSRRMPGSSAFAPKGNLGSKISVEETALSKRWPHLYQRMKLEQEESLKQIRAHHWRMVLVGIASFGSVGYVASNV